MVKAKSANADVLSFSSRAALAALFLVSGFAALVYEVLWLKELSLLFGNTAQAASATLSAFFLGMAGGGWLWGKRAPTLRSPLRTYALLEAGVAATALPCLGLLFLYEVAYEPLYAALGSNTALLTAAKFLLACAVLFPPAFLMGGTFPVMGQFLVRRPGDLGRVGSFLYSINTLGAAAGVLAAGFVLPQLLGYNASYFVAVGLNLLVAAACWRLSGRLEANAGISPQLDKSRSRKLRRTAVAPAVPAPAALAFLSGALTLGLEVLWTRMFSQVLQNSVYTFSAILVVFLFSLSVGALLANRLCRWSASPAAVLPALLTAAGVAVALSPFWFMEVTHGMRYLGDDLDWGGYVVAIFARTFQTLALPAILIGAVFPYLLRTVEGSGAPGELLGRMTAWNTLGSVTGAAMAGFVILPTAGMWGGLRLAALAYLLTALALVTGASRSALARRAVPALAILLLLTIFDPTRLPLLRSNPSRERILDIRQGGHGVVAVVETTSRSRRIKVNNFYRLGGTSAQQHEQNQSLIPLMPHPDPHSLFYLGMGTGITAGASLSVPGVERVVVCELIPEVVEVGARYFNSFANGLFTDSRAQVLAADGRNHLRGSRERYDAILADLFIPWKQGAGGLYSLEHFRTVRSRLKPGGIFVQWIPLYQVGREELEIVARTMLAAFPEVVLWRGDFYPEKPILALVGAEDPLVLDPAVIVERGRAMARNDSLPAEAIEAVTLPFYAGNLGRSRSVLNDGPLNTDDRPVIEHGSPQTHRSARSGSGDWFVGAQLAGFLDAIARQTPPEADPYLARLDARQIGYVEAGRMYYRATLAERRGDLELAKRYRAETAARIPAAMLPGVDDSDIGAEIEE